MKNKEYQSIMKMIEYINRAEQYTSGLTFEEFTKNNIFLNFEDAIFLIF